MELWQKYIIKSGRLSEIINTYVKLREHLQELGYTEAELRKPNYYTRDMFVLRDKINYIMIKIQKELDLYGLEIEQKDFHEFIQNKLSKVDLEYPLKKDKNGNNQ